MEVGITADQRQSVIDAMDANSKLASLLVAMVEAASLQNLAAKSNETLESVDDVLPAAPSLREKFDAISVMVPNNGKFFDVAVPNETFDKSYDQQAAIAGEIGGRMSSKDEIKAVAEYLLSQDKAGTITDKEAALLKVYRNSYLLHTEGWVRVEDRYVRICLDVYNRSGRFDTGALIVCLSAESK